MLQTDTYLEMAFLLAFYDIDEQHNEQDKSTVSLIITISRTI